MPDCITFPGVQLSIVRDPRTLADFVVIRDRATGWRLALVPSRELPVGFIKPTAD